MGFLAIASKFGDRLRREPAALWETGAALVRGTWYAAFFRIARRDVRIQLPFLAYAPVRITGPGSVRIGRRCTVHLTAFEGLVISTLNPTAVVRIGMRCNLGGVTVRCAKRVELGDRVMTATCLIQDQLFSTPREGHDAEIAGPNDILIGAGVWLTAQTIVLAGSRIGEASVLSLSSVYYAATVPEGHVAIGNLSYNSLSISGLHGIKNA